MWAEYGLLAQQVNSPTDPSWNLFGEGKDNKPASYSQEEWTKNLMCLSTEIFLAEQHACQINDERIFVFLPKQFILRTEVPVDAEWEGRPLFCSHKRLFTFVLC